MKFGQNPCTIVQGLWPDFGATLKICKISNYDQRGIMVGLWFASFGIGYLCNVIMAVLLFHCQNVSNCTSFYYYLAKSILVLTILIIFVILARRYKYRVKENEANIYQIVDNQYDLYMQQEDNYHNNEA